MAAYIVGIIMGAITVIFPLIYMMAFELSRAVALSHQPDLRIQPYFPENILYGTSALGAVVLLVSTALMAFTGLRRLGRAEREAEAAGEAEASEQQP